jgi:hypothetical protein
MTQRSNQQQAASTRGKRPVAIARAAADANVPALLIQAAPIAAALILVLVLITSLASAEYGFV